MLVLEIDKTELFDESTDRFITIPHQYLKLEHSLVSISKWESKWLKPFLSTKEKTTEETLYYIKCMVVGNLNNEDVLKCLTKKHYDQIADYIDYPMTATTVHFHGKEKPNKEKITSELIYYWMIACDIPFECEKWHINRLLMLIKVCGAKNSNKKMSSSEAAKMRSDLNAQRRAKFKSKG